MGATATLRMLLLGDDRSASKALGNAGNEAEKTGRKFNALGGHSTVLGHKFGSLGKLAGGIFGGAALLEGGEMAVDVLKDSVKAAAADEKQNAVLERQMKNTAHAREEDVKATEEWLKAQAEATGISRDQLTPELTKLVTVTHDTGKAQKLLKLAMDVSAGSGKSLTAITDGLVRAQNGNVGGLSRLGVATKDASGKALTFQQIQKNLAHTFRGDAASAADTAQGRMKRLGVTWEEMKVELGEKLLPVLVKFSGWILNTGIPAVEKIIGFLAKHKIALMAVAAAVGFLVGGPFVALAAAFVVLWTHSQKFRDIMTAAFKIVVNVFLGLVGAILNGAAKAFGWIPGLGGKLKTAADNFNHFRDQVNAALDGIHAQKDIHLNVTTTQSVQVSSINKPRVPHSAVGARFAAGGPMWVGERGAEILDVPRGSRVYTAAQSAAMTAGGGGNLGTLTVVVRSESGEVLERKLATLKRTRGGAALAFA